MRVHSKYCTVRRVPILMRLVNVCISNLEDSKQPNKTVYPEENIADQILL